MNDVNAAIENVGKLEVYQLERGLPTLATSAGAAPMIGFLGTVIGMIRAFWDMSNAGSNIDVSLLSSGIYTAMVTTAAGLFVGPLHSFGSGSSDSLCVRNLDSQRSPIASVRFLRANELREELFVFTIRWPHADALLGLFASPINQALLL